MSSAKITTMVLNTVDLQCCSCYKKVKKVLCKFPEIRDQVYDEKNSKVTIKVLCCDPEKIRDKLCCKGRKVIKSIEIVDDAPTPQTTKKKKTETSEAPDNTKEAVEQEPTEAPEKSKEEKPKVKTEDQAPKVDEAVPVSPGGACCGTCAQGYGGGPCYQGYRRPVPRPPGPCYDYVRPLPPPPGPCYDYVRPLPPPPCPCYDYGDGYRGSKCCVSTDYFSEENPQGCTIM